MRRKTMGATNTLTLSWCMAVIIVIGTWLPPMVEAPTPPKIGLQEARA